MPTVKKSLAFSQDRISRLTSFRGLQLNLKNHTSEKWTHVLKILRLEKMGTGRHRLMTLRESTGGLSSSLLMKLRNSSVQNLPLDDFIKARYAFELLTDELLKRDYDIYSIDEHLHVIEEVKERYSGKHISEIDLPLIKDASSDTADQDSSSINSQNFLSMFEDDKALLIQIISSGSNRCAQFSANWNRIVHLLDGVAKPEQLNVVMSSLLHI